MLSQKKVEEKEPELNLNVTGCQTIGFPLQTSSPSVVEFSSVEGSGDGDRQTAKLMHDLLSPIHTPEKRHGITSNTVKTPSSKSPIRMPALLLDNSLGKSALASEKQSPSLEQEILLSEKVSGMEEGEARKLLRKVLMDNIALRKDLKTKEKHIAAYQNQTLAIMSWISRNEIDAEKSGPAFPQEENVELTPQKTFRSTQEITIMEEENGVTRSLSFINGVPLVLVASIDVDRELLKDRLINGYNMTNQLLLGAVAGWLSAFFIKKFGKFALTATSGGIVLLVYTARKGFVNVNYESIYQEISKICDKDNASVLENSKSEDADKSLTDKIKDANGSNYNLSFNKSGDNGVGVNASNIKSTDDLNQMCTYDKLKQAKNWITSHTYSVGGFVLTFMYHIM